LTTVGFCPSQHAQKEAQMSIWLLIVIIVLVVLAFGGFRRFGRR
jgi:hypothetical protein